MIKYKFTFLVIVAALINYSCLAQTFNRAKMDSLMDILAVNSKTMLSIALSQNGKLVYRRAIGYSAIDSNHKMIATPNTRYRIGSITKVFTSVMIFQLIEEGKLKLGTTLATYYPMLPNADKITLAHMLNHSSGLHNFTDDSTYASMLSKKVTQEEMLGKFKAAKSDFEPGSKNAYSNTNFILLGYIIEKVDHKPYDVALTDRIVNKIHLRNTYYGGKINTMRQEAQSYNWQGGWVPDTETDMSIPGGAGAIVSTPTELLKFMTALFTGKLLRDSSLQHMITIKGGYGMDLVAHTFDNETGYGHNGGIDGFQSQLVYYPQEGLATAYTANGVNTSMNKLMRGVLSIYFNKPYPLPNYKTILLKPEYLDQYLGKYSSKQVPYNLVFTKKDGRLVVRFTDESTNLPLEATSSTIFTYDRYDLTFSFDPSTHAVVMNAGSNVFSFTKDK